MLERASTRMLPLVNRAADMAPIAPACCNVCRSCMTTNIAGLAVAGVSAAALGIRRFARRFANGS